jgi:hypothetical protein
MPIRYRSQPTAYCTPSGFRITRASGVESEVDLAFVGLHQLCASVLDRLERLPTVGRTPFAKHRARTPRAQICQSPARHAERVRRFADSGSVKQPIEGRAPSQRPPCKCTTRGKGAATPKTSGATRRSRGPRRERRRQHGGRADPYGEAARRPETCSAVLFYAVAEADFETSTYERYADGPWLTREAMRWFWDA